MMMRKRRKDDDGEEEHPYIHCVFKMVFHSSCSPSPWFVWRSFSLANVMSRFLCAFWCLVVVVVVVAAGPSSSSILSSCVRPMVVVTETSFLCRVLDGGSFARIIRGALPVIVDMMMGYTTEDHVHLQQLNYP